MMAGDINLELSRIESGGEEELILVERAEGRV